jgi:hypothetical protein
MWAKGETRAEVGNTHIGVMRGYSRPSSIAVNDRVSIVAGGGR